MHLVLGQVLEIIYCLNGESGISSVASLITTQETREIIMSIIMKLLIC